MHGKLRFINAHKPNSNRNLAQFNENRNSFPIGEDVEKKVSSMPDRKISIKLALK